MFSQSYEFKKELVKTFSCQTSELIITNFNKIAYFMIFIGIIQNSLCVISGIFIVFLSISELGINPYVS
jgi:hypothetical protein